MPGRRQAGTLKRRQPPISVKETDGQVLLKPDAVQSPDSGKEVKGRMVAAHDDVLAVIHYGARGGIKKGTRPPAQVGLLFEQAHTAPFFRQCDTRRQARKTAANDQDFVRHESRNQDSGSRREWRFSSIWSRTGSRRLGTVFAFHKKCVVARMPSPPSEIGRLDRLSRAAYEKPRDSAERFPSRSNRCLPVRPGSTRFPRCFRRRQKSSSRAPSPRPSGPDSLFLETNP